MKLFKDKIFFKSMLAIALPIALQNLITSSVNMVDTLMISSLGQTSIAAVGLANQFFFFYILITFGINSGSSIFIAQYWGKKDIPSIRKVLGLAVSLSSLVGVIFTAVALVFPQLIMRILIDEPEVIRIGSDYLRIVSISYIPTAISFAFSVALRTTGKPKIPMKISAISFVTNTVFNYIFIFGKLGLPAMGVKGAALGTLISRFIEIGVTLYAVYSTKGVLAANIKELLSWNKDFVKRYLKTTYPVILAEAAWSLGQVMYSIAYAKLGEEATAAVQITNTIQNIFFVLVRGLANACTVMIGSKIGSGDEDEAFEYAKNFMVLSIILGLVLGTIQATTPNLTLKLFSGLDQSLYEVSRKLLIIMGMTFIIRVFNSTGIVGVLRGGGDTTFGMIIDIGSVWIVGVPLAFIGAMLLDIPVYMVYAIVSIEELIKVIVIIPRIISKKWIKNIT
ncbi:MATE family efflux transporter [Sedimentibacter sp. MB31-C6]|uniref:MATE family efflux transporter n=1 Tax=Sedimentibacter sp. MB31-C6 TaxID=3109366 RepID=UPI002DDC9430|nr:MATE family efflux transporter [Sedimentibacter sp. MB36-C1]WSI04574.1 MATE family efflux transporter [Sedimentibacter sp. MB36-C1]